MTIEEKVKIEGKVYGFSPMGAALISQDDCIALIKEACAKQKMECWENFDKLKYTVNTKHIVLNAPEPTWEE